MSTEPSNSLAAIYVAFFVLQWIFNIGMGAWIYFNKGDRRNAGATAAVAKKLDAFIAEQKEKMARLEESVKHLPTDEEVGALREDVATTKALQMAMAEAMRRVEHQTNLIHEHLLRNRVV